MHERLPCEQFEVGIADLLDGALPPDQRRRFEAHLKTCPECREQLQSVRRTIDRVSSLPRVPMPPWMKVRVLHAGRSAPPSPRSILVRRRAAPVSAAEVDD